MSEKNKVLQTAESIWEQHKNFTDYKAKIGRKGLYEQTERNEKFYVGDQWLGNETKSKLPLIVINVIKRIGEYKLSQLLSNPLTANFSADGISSYVDDDRATKNDNVISDLQAGKTESFEALSEDEKMILTFSALTDYFNATCERLKFDNLCQNATKNAYVSGTGAIYTYWDDEVDTGLFADTEKKTAIKGDIVSEVINAEEQLDFENPAQKDIDKQDYIIISQKMTVEKAKRIAKQNGLQDSEIEKIKEDSSDAKYSYERDKDLDDTVKRVTVLTKLFKEYNDDGTDFTLKAVMSTKDVIIREEWETGLKKYPVAIFSWIDREKSIFGDSEVTYLIPNQIAINRMITAAVWSSMLNGMPIMLVNKNLVKGAVTNQPGQIWEFNGSEDMRNAAGYINPPQTSPALSSNAMDIINNTLQHAGANDAALGNLRSDNATAIVTLQEAANAPMQPLKNRYYQFVEDLVRIWAEFWIKNYGERKLKISDKNGNWYLPFDGEKYKNIVLSVRIDVGASTMWTSARSTEILENWHKAGDITFLQELERFPSGVVNDLSGLIKEAKKAQMEQQQLIEQQQESENNIEKMGEDTFYDELDDEEAQAYDDMDYAERQNLIENAKAAVAGEE